MRLSGCELEEKEALSSPQTSQREGALQWLLLNLHLFQKQSDSFRSNLCLFLLFGDLQVWASTATVQKKLFCAIILHFVSSVILKSVFEDFNGSNLQFCT